jgi:hypothetical protein
MGSGATGCALVKNAFSATNIDQATPAGYVSFAYSALASFRKGNVGVGVGVGVFTESKQKRRSGYRGKPMRLSRSM